MKTEDVFILIRESESGETEVRRTMNVEVLSRAIATLRHELGNPVNAVSTMLRLLQRKHRELSDEKLERYFQRSLQEMEQLQELIRRLSRSKILEGSKEQRVSLPSFVTRLLNHVGSRAGEATSSIVVEIEPQDAEVDTDPRALQAALSELLLNALDAVAEIEEPRVELTIVRRPEELTIRIEDNGHGLGVEGRERFFEPLWTTREDHEGMGCFIALTAIAAMGGSLEVIDKEQGGVITILHLPGVANGVC